MSKYRHPLYNIYKLMKYRCLNTSSPAYKDYGKRGITVSDEWIKDFWVFVSDIGDRPSPMHTLDRKDNDASYSKDNCRWATPVEQANNQRTTRLLTYNGKTQSVSAWSREAGVSPATITTRLDRGLPMHLALKKQYLKSKTGQELPQSLLASVVPLTEKI